MAQPLLITLRTTLEAVNLFASIDVSDYDVNTETFQDASQYVKSLQEKAATSAQESMFQMESESLSESESSGFSLGAAALVPLWELLLANQSWDK